MSSIDDAGFENVALDDDKTPRTPNSDDDFDDDLGVPHSLMIVSVEGTPIVVERKDDRDNTNKGKIAYSAIYRPTLKFSSYNRKIFIPEVEINATIVDYERNLTSHFLNPNLYTISFKHGDFVWKIKKRYNQIQHLHQQLVLFRTSLNIPFPTKTHREKRESFRNKKPKGTLPRFPKKPEVLVSYERIDQRIKQLEEYLNNLLSISIYRTHPETIAFLEVSHLSFIDGLGIKGKEGFVKKGSGSTRGCCNCMGCINSTFCIRCSHRCNDFWCTRWLNRWFFVKDTCFGYIDPKDGRIKCVVLFDQGFEVSFGMYATGLHTGLQLVTLSRQIVIKCGTRRHAKEWQEALKESANFLAKDFTQLNQHHSFAPIRNNIIASWFVDGATYMEAVADAIESAKEEVFIADWWLSPEIYLKRPAVDGDYWRLDKLLKRKAKQGVKIFVLLYKEVEMALGLNSYYSKQKLTEDCDDNIKVLRHPDHAKVGVFLWAHHEKIVVVDQTFAFLGGIDLCYGRWDDNQHRLTAEWCVTQPTVDVSTLRKKSSSVPGGEPIYPIPVPYYKRACELPDTPDEDYQESSSSSEATIPQLAPGDHLLLPNMNTSTVKCNTPEMERKNVLSTIKNKGTNLIKMIYSPNEDSVECSGVEGGDKIEANGTVMLQEPQEDLRNLDGSAKFWIGKDYVNFIVKDFTNLDSPFTDFIDRVTTPRMPWHDVGVCVQKAAARDVARHFIQRWNATKLEKAKFNPSYPYLLPKSYDFKTNIPEILTHNTHTVTCQVLRSCSTWSIGFLEPDTVEQSIHEAYIDIITRSQHYIYIENQFFITLPYSNPNTRNQIAEALFKRILRAHKEKAVFRVYVVMPLLPAFEGEIGDATGTSLHTITHWNYLSICRGKDSLLNRLKEAGVSDPSQYINFYGLRTHSKLNGEPITELVYVHSKLMIVDDKMVICGSANINDRSLIGKRDSEIAVLIEDETFDEGAMNGECFPSGKFAGGLRRQLFKEHLGLLGKENECIDIDITDPISEQFYKNVWYEKAKLNTSFYEKVFHCIPSDRVENFASLKEIQQELPLYSSEVSRAEKMLESIEGNLVLLPLNFLSKEVLTPAPGSFEGMMPTSLWT
ncbi:LOW QUALITY PROTEIN: phospholipase D2 [Agrilus planipennis]|uniref:Phospholipase n=1 Tax=Agrilus planipennis TaxID=224129 RepID=A0A7F5R2B8_AGRPL|nr:LOW QUALITY PROTEIN: phospholipase D2 [Agrilus planipennis]